MSLMLFFLLGILSSREPYLIKTKSTAVVEFLPADINDAVIGNDKIFVSVLMKSQVFVFDLNGNPLPPLGTKGMGPNEIMFPTALAFQGDTLFILDRGKGTLVSMDPETGTIKDSIRYRNSNALLVAGDSLFVSFNMPINDRGPKMIGRAELHKPSLFVSHYYDEPCCLQIQGTKTSAMLVDRDNQLWIAYTGEYRLEIFRIDALIKRIELAPDDYVVPRELTRKQQYDRKARSEHYRSFDKMGGFYQVGDLIILHRFKSMNDARLDVYDLSGTPIQLGIPLSKAVPFSTHKDTLLGYREAETEEDLLLEFVEIGFSLPQK